MIFVTGDLHGEHDIYKLDHLKEQVGSQLTRDDYVIILGDFGMIWSADTKYGYLDDQIRLKEYFEEKYPWTTIFIDGNHENFVHLKKFPSKKWGGARANFLSEHCIWLRRGNIYTIDGKTILTIGGAYSIDKAWRRPYISWWPEEAITRSDINKAKRNLATHKNKVDYILTHCAPTPIHQTIARQEKFTPHSHGKKPETQNEALLQEINEIAGFKRWYFGHYHIDREFEDGRFVCLYNQVQVLHDDKSYNPVTK